MDLRTLGLSGLLLASGCVSSSRPHASPKQPLYADGSADAQPLTSDSLAPAQAATSSGKGPPGASKYPVPCSTEEQAVCDVLLNADQLLAAEQPQAASVELARMFQVPDLSVSAAQLSFEDASAVDCWRGLTVARTLLQSSSLSFGQGDERSRVALGILERMKGGAVPPALIHRLELDMTRSYLALGDAERARPLAERLIERHPDDAEGQASLGIALLGLGRVEQSLRPLLRAQQLQPDEPERWLVLGTAQMLLSDAPAAERSFRAALSTSSGARTSTSSTEELLARCYGNLGAVLLVQGQAEQGRSYLDRALRLRPRQATFRANLAYAQYLLGNFAQAEAEAQRAIAADAQLIAAWLNLGLAQAQQQKFVEARHTFTHAQSIDPTDPRPSQSLADLEELRERLESTSGVP